MVAINIASVEKVEKHLLHRSMGGDVFSVLAHPDCITRDATMPHCFELSLTWTEKGQPKSSTSQVPCNLKDAENGYEDEKAAQDSAVAIRQDSRPDIKVTAKRVVCS